ncbi:hypothetical protein BOQ54_03105 [Chelatococcus daeguensis]|uniref:Uncharacterized protein n=1 Tax=Chelatococcus daeguensis TaxID=444444 RepID=A0AAC9NYC5_9HYPH|nr:hypothetical protein BOQ54_03105 [Chelatococcus daeguensis]
MAIYPLAEVAHQSNTTGGNSGFVEVPDEQLRHASAHQRAARGCVPRQNIKVERSRLRADILYGIHRVTKNGYHAIMLSVRQRFSRWLGKGGHMNETPRQSEIMQRQEKQHVERKKNASYGSKSIYAYL